MKNLEQIYKNHLKHFLICHQIWQKFNLEYILLDNLTFKFVVSYEVNKTNSYMKLVKKLETIQAKVAVISKTLFNFFQKMQMFNNGYLEKEFKGLYQVIIPNLSHWNNCNKLKCNSCFYF